MKKILYILLLLTQIVYSQTRIDSLVLVELNVYRKSLNLNPVTFSKDCYIISEDHSKKLVETKDSLYHSDNFIRAEVVQVISNYRMPNDEKDPDLILAKEIIKKWKNSKEHNRIITSPKYSFAGVSTKMIGDVKTASVFDPTIKRFKTVYLYSLFSTMNFK